MLLGIDLNRRASYESEPRVIEIIVGKLFHRYILGNRAIPDIEIERKERTDSGAGLGVPMPEIVLSDLAVIVGKSFWISLGFRE